MPYDNQISRSDAAALIPEEASMQIWQMAPASSIILGTMPCTQIEVSRGQHRVPVEENLPEAYFRDGEEDLSQNTSLSWRNVFLEVGEVVVDVVVKKTTLEDSAFDIWAYSIPKVAEAFGRRFDNAVIRRLGAPSNWPQGLLTQAAAASMEFDYSNLVGAGSDLYDIVMGEGGMLDKLELNGFDCDGFVAAPGMKAKIRGLRAEDGHPLFAAEPREGGGTNYSFDGKPVAFPRNGGIDRTQSLLIAAEWRQLVVGIRHDIRMEVFRSGVIQNTAGQVIHNLNQQGKVNLQFTMRAGWVLPNPVNPINPDDATRFPVAYLKP